MVSYEDLIYHFTDIYLKTAMECSICKENYSMVDDVDFLDEYMKLFVSLLMAVEQDDTLELNSLKQTLENRKAEKLNEYHVFLKHKIVESALEAVQESEKNTDSLSDNSMYIDKIQRFCQEVFDQACESKKKNPVELLGYVRIKEEAL